MNRTARAIDFARLSLPLVLSYAFDWIVLAIVAALAGVIATRRPHHRPFALDDQQISQQQAVPLYLLLILCIVVPIVIIPVVVLVLVPGRAVSSHGPRSHTWAWKLWETHVGWLGLALSLVTVWFFTEAMKNLLGKPRPDLLDRCDPDLDAASDYIVGGLSVQSDTGRLYSVEICQQSNTDRLADGFRSFPSGHSSASAAGLIYLSLFLASKFGVMFPYTPYSKAGPTETRSCSSSSMATSADGRKVQEHHANASARARRGQAAAAPLYLLAIALVPSGLAVYISASRWFDFRHHGFDILFGFLMGVLTAFFSFWYYHMPLHDGTGWAWGPRSTRRAFWSGPGQMGYADKSLGLARMDRRDVEMGNVADTTTSGGRAPGAIPSYRPGS
ncbi:hypothetical protein S7711_10300 [Stachybotrys chartarum IBT 7711]|uniref:Phosphatidic acid phosphatase type 2/haloperoxidase domain-containing protein n=1 Tax=Stachybotrys chartarum (strain CBS 109288 / IBT 7711) TaxID=1280523 RepID=A0A084AF58_STACB|nr:hypothetical protein S7711_10300 [Stachybotrys chartarum IBT 7711]KFA47650.1 hypothetical protein S40293_07654 [Stachybotrys chartarum IBT 40293]